MQGASHALCLQVLGDLPPCISRRTHAHPLHIPLSFAIIAVHLHHRGVTILPVIVQSPQDVVPRPLVHVDCIVVKLCSHSAHKRPAAIYTAQGAPENPPPFHQQTEGALNALPHGGEVEVEAILPHLQPSARPRKQQLRRVDEGLVSNPIEGTWQRALLQQLLHRAKVPRQDVVRGPSADGAEHEEAEVGIAARQHHDPPAVVPIAIGHGILDLPRVRFPGAAHPAIDRQGAVTHVAVAVPCKAVCHLAQLCSVVEWETQVHRGIECFQRPPEHSSVLEKAAEADAELEADVDEAATRQPTQRYSQLRLWRDRRTATVDTILLLSHEQVGHLLQQRVEGVAGESEHPLEVRIGKLVHRRQCEPTVALQNCVAMSRPLGSCRRLG
mmetsp:Transcript_29084/g.64579  ORF Transcript_29084/g.64579 Transcript_29084/m.64579 type:complete len:384 (-) Transcript_29084:239-1390(-)